MANVIIFDDGINSTTIAELIDIIEEKRTFDDDEIILYFTTDGGYTHSANTFIPVSYTHLTLPTNREV